METLVPSDHTILDLLRQQERMTVGDFEAALGVTATAVRQRLNRLLGKGYIERHKEAAIGRGRPSHWYQLTKEGRRNTGSNFVDLAMVLWEELRAVNDAEVRRGLLQRISQRLAAQYRERIQGASVAQRMESVVGLLAERQIPFELQRTEGRAKGNSEGALDSRAGETGAKAGPSESQQLPVLTALACPYPDLAEQDRSVCAMERMMLSELLGEAVALEECRLDGAACCTFAVRGGD